MIMITFINEINAISIQKISKYRLYVGMLIFSPNFAFF